MVHRWRGRLDFAGDARQRVQQIGAADDADDLLSANDRHALDRRFSIRATTSSSGVSSPTVNGLARHHVADLAAVRAGVFVGQRPGPTGIRASAGRLRSVPVSRAGADRLR